MDKRKWIREQKNCGRQNKGYKNGNGHATCM